MRSLLLLIVCAPVASAAPVLLRAARLYEPSTGVWVKPAEVLIDGEKIVRVGAGQNPADAEVIELGDLTLLPGLIDAHTHLMMRESSKVSYDQVLMTRSVARRALDGAANARATLQAGFTSVRDVESEGSGYADVALRDAIDEGLVEGPRMQVATEGIGAVVYHPRGLSPDRPDAVMGVRLISGVEEARKAARDQLRYGADLIKLYADFSLTAADSQRRRIGTTLTLDEMKAAIEVAKPFGRKVAVHAQSPAGIRNAVLAGASSIEHGSLADKASLELMAKQGVVLVPTVGAQFFTAREAKDPAARQRAQERNEKMRTVLATAMQLKVVIVSGFDAISEDEQGLNARELLGLSGLGVPNALVLKAATCEAARLMGWDDRVGSLSAGKFADVIAVPGDPIAEMNVLERVQFVMKGGKVVKNQEPARR